MHVPVARTSLVYNRCCGLIVLVRDDFLSLSFPSLGEGGVELVRSKRALNIPNYYPKPELIKFRNAHYMSDMEEIRAKERHKGRTGPEGHNMDGLKIIE